MMWNYGWGGWESPWTVAVMVLFWGGVIALGVWAIRALSGPRPGGDQALDVLRTRLAAGEITPEEFTQAKRVLSE